MAMKKATKERITAAYDKGFGDGETSGYARAKWEFDKFRDAALRKSQARSAFTDSLEAEADPE